MTDNGKRIKHMATEFTSIKMGQNMRACGRMTANMEKVQRSGMTAPCLMGISKMVSSTDKVTIFGPTNLNTMEIGTII